MQEPSSLADAILEIPASELQHFFDDMIITFNALNDLLKDQGILRGRELAELNTKANQAVKAERSPLGKLLLLNAYLRKQISYVGSALKARTPATPTDQGVIRQAITKIGLRALAIVEHVKIIAEGKKEVAFNSAQTRDFLAGREGKPPSRRDTIRALKRAEKICPALVCKPTPNDGRQTMRLTARAEDLKDPSFVEEPLHCATRQRSRMDEIRMIFFKEGVF
jgi:hypothetical protein